MSQQIAADPVAAAATLAATTPTTPDQSNRREIPITSFDFLQGAFVAAKKARRIAMFALIAVLGGLAWTVASTLLTRIEAERVAAEASQLRLREEEAISSLGESLGGDVNVRMVLERDISLSAALSEVAASQMDITKALAQIEEIPGQGVVINQIAIGDRAVGERSDLPPGPHPQILIIGASTELRTLVSWADTMRSSGVFESFDYERSPGTIRVTGYTSVSTAAPQTLQKISSLGVNVVVEDIKALPASTNSGSNKQPEDDE